MNGHDSSDNELIKKIDELTAVICEAPIPMLAINKDHKITHFNKACEELTGFLKEDMIGTEDQWKAFYNEKRPILVDLIVDKASDAEIIKHYGFKYKRLKRATDRYSAEDFFPDLGEKGKWLAFTVANIKDENNEIIGTVETIQDITDEKNAEEKMRNSKKHYRMLVEFVPYPIIVYDNEGLASYLNPAFTQTFGWTLEELEGKIIPFVPEELDKETKDALRKFFKERSLTRYETQRYTKDGALLDVTMWATSFSRQGQASNENFVILRDITEEKRIAAYNKTIMRISTALPEYPELEELMNYLTKEIKTILNTEGAIVLLYDELENEVFFLGAAYDDSDTEKRAKKVRFPLNEVLAGEVIKSGKPVIENDPLECAKYPERDRKLGYKTKNLMVVPIKSDERIIGTLVALNKKQGLFEDIDIELLEIIAGTVAISIENARFSEEVKKAYKEVAIMNHAKGKAINHLSHELKTPVAILTGSVSALKKKLSDLEDKKWVTTIARIERNLNRIVEIQTETADIMENKAYSSHRLLLKMLHSCKDELVTLIDQNIDQGMSSDNVIGTVTQMIDEQFGLSETNSKNIDLDSFLPIFHDTLKEKYSSRDVDVSLNIHEQISPISIPQDILSKILEGLIKNGIENTPDGGSIIVSLEDEDNGVLLKVHDFGVGIKEDDRQNIFGGFFTTQETMHYSTKNPYEFNAGGKGADLLRMKIFSERYGFSLSLESKRCKFLVENLDSTCPGNIKKCIFCKSKEECEQAGYTVFSLLFSPI
ncbi:MAG: PAS domain S-box protein [Desulfobacteraceae bacterium]|nr:PAS domain S-box protein [Desulfobacteraceae bacterium]